MYLLQISVTFFCTFILVLYGTNHLLHHFLHSRSTHFLSYLYVFLEPKQHTKHGESRLLGLIWHDCTNLPLILQSHSCPFFFTQLITTRGNFFFPTYFALLGLCYTGHRHSIRVGSSKTTELDNTKSNISSLLLSLTSDVREGPTSPICQKRSDSMTKSLRSVGTKRLAYVTASTECSFNVYMPHR